jgi:hypothetical protein
MAGLTQEELAERADMSVNAIMVKTIFMLAAYPLFC